jgi:hypothetical protein
MEQKIALGRGFKFGTRPKLGIFSFCSIRIFLNPFFFCFCRAFFSVEKSLKGVQGAELKPKKTLGCLVPFSSLA